MGKYLLACLTMLCLASCTLAISNATINGSSQTRWNGSLVGDTSVTSQGGNITNVNITSVSLTGNWMGFFGNVFGSIILGTNQFSMYNWTWQPSSSSSVCVAQNSTFDFSSANSTNSTAINNAWNFSGKSDNATNTYNLPSCNLTLGSQQVSNTASAKHNPLSNFTTCAISRVSTPSIPDDFAYCAGIINGGMNYMGDSVQYELLVPSQAGPSTSPYYFFAELT